MEQSKHKKAIGALLLSSLLWGAAYVVMKSSLDSITPFYLLGMRFGLSAIVLCMVFYKKVRHISKKVWKNGAFMGILLYIEFLFFTLGLQYTTATKSSFIIGAYVILIPLVYFIVNRRRPGMNSVIASFVCLVGLAFVMLDGVTGMNKGDLITCISSVGYAFHIVLTTKYVKNEDPIALNIVQILVAGVLALVVAMIVEPVPTSFSIREGSNLAYLAIGGTILPYLLSVYGQKYTKTTTAAILLSFESVFGCILAILILGDTLTLRFVIGATLILSSFIVSEFPVSKEKTATCN